MLIYGPSQSRLLYGWVLSIYLALIGARNSLASALFLAMKIPPNPVLLALWWRRPFDRRSRRMPLHYGVHRIPYCRNVLLLYLRFLWLAKFVLYSDMQAYSILHGPPAAALTNLTAHGLRVPAIECTASRMTYDLYRPLHLAININPQWRIFTAQRLIHNTLGKSSATVTLERANSRQVPVLCQLGAETVCLRQPPLIDFLDFRLSADTLFLVLYEYMLNCKTLRRHVRHQMERSAQRLMSKPNTYPLHPERHLENICNSRCTAFVLPIQKPESIRTLTPALSCER